MKIYGLRLESLLDTICEPTDPHDDEAMKTQKRICELDVLFIYFWARKHFSSPLLSRQLSK